MQIQYLGSPTLVKEASDRGNFGCIGLEKFKLEDYIRPRHPICIAQRLCRNSCKASTQFSRDSKRAVNVLGLKSAFQSALYSTQGLVNSTDFKTYALGTPLWLGNATGPQCAVF